MLEVTSKPLVTNPMQALKKRTKMFMLKAFMKLGNTEKELSEEGWAKLDSVA